LNHPTYFVADIAASHDGHLSRAKDLIRLAFEAGADAVKFQNYCAETIVSDFGFKSLESKQSHQSNWAKSVFEVYGDFALPLDWTEELKEECSRVGIHYFTAPYDTEMLAGLSDYVCAWKIGSGDITWHSHIEAIAKDGKPVLLATGASDMEEVRSATNLILKYTNDLVLMQCNTNYTASIENLKYVSLDVLKCYASEYPNVVLGLSDHTPGHVTVLGAVALGARVIEKHFTDDTTREGPDHLFSMDPLAWNAMVVATRQLEAAFGNDEKRVMENEKETVVLQRRAIRAKRLIRVGEIIDDDCIIPLRPCPVDGLPPYRESELLGKRAKNEISQGDCVRFKDVH
jgi:N-acetylneuraminate synthase